MLFSTCYRMPSTMHSASIACRMSVLNSILVSADMEQSRLRCLLSISSRSVASIGRTMFANSQKLNRMSSSPSYLEIISLASAESHVTPSLSKPWTSSAAPKRIIELSVNCAKAVSRVKSFRSQRATLRSSRAFSIAVTSRKQFLCSQSRQASESDPAGRCY